MIRIENDCYGCTLPCIDCGRKRTPHYYCDECGEESELYEYDTGEQLCKYCILKRYKIVEGSEEI